MPSSTAAIVPITLTVNDRTGVTLYAPPWEDEDGEQWQGFLGDGTKILLYPTTADLAAFVASGQENDLSDHPAWGQVQQTPPDQLRPEPEDRYDLDQVYAWAADEPDPVHVSALANVVDMVARIADVCDDGALRSLVEGTAAYAELVDEDVSYHGKDGRKRWNELGDVIAGSWERALRRVGDCLEWVGDFSTSEFDEEQTLWEHVGAEPIRLVLPDAVYLTVQAEVPTDPDTDATEMAFLGESGIGRAGSVAVFTTVADLARYCREATKHRLQKLEWWGELAEAPDEDFEPETEFDLRSWSDDAAAMLRDLADYCDLEADTSVLDTSPVSDEDWSALLTEVETCFDVRG